MGVFVESWANADRWLHLNAAGFETSGGYLMPAVGQQNPLLQFRQNVSMGLVVEMYIFPDDDLQLSLVKPAESIDFANQGSITYFGISYESQYASISKQFVLSWRSAWNDVLQNVLSGTLANQTKYRLLFSVIAGVVRVKVFTELGELVVDITQSGVLTGDMTFLVNPGRVRNGPARPWIGRSTFLWDASQAIVDASMAAGTITLTPVSAPAITDSPSFKEGIYNVWRSPAFGGSGNLSVLPRSSLPTGLSVAFQGNQLVIFGAPAAGTAGSYPLLLDITDGVSVTTIAISLQLVVSSSWTPSPSEVSAAAIALGDWYYEVSGGPMRKEFHDNS